MPTAPMMVRAEPAVRTRPALGRVLVVAAPPARTGRSPVPGPVSGRSSGLATGLPLDLAAVIAAQLDDRATDVGLLPADLSAADLFLATVDGPRPDLIVGLTDGLGRARTAARLAERFHARLVLLVEGLAARPAEQVPSELRRADRLAVPSEAFRHPLRAAGVPDARIALLPPMVGAVPSWLDRSDARRRLGWPERAFIAVHAGPLEAGQDLTDVVAAAALLGPTGVLALTGDGPARAAVEAHAAGIRNVLVPDLDGENQALALVAADVLVLSEPGAGDHLTARRELAQYLAAGRPVVATAPVSGTAAAELARTGGAGLVVPPGEPGRLAGALLALHADPTRRVAMGLAGIAYAGAHLSRRAVLARLDAIVDAALTGPPAGGWLR